MIPHDRLIVGIKNMNHTGPGYNHLVYMQCTGLKNKNGTDIYEGDVLKSAGKRGENYIVLFEKGRFISRSTGFNGLSKTTQERCDRQEVIGNIYSNPDLCSVKYTEEITPSNSKYELPQSRL